MSKLIVKSKDIEDKTLEAVSLILDPIAQTMSPKGGNVLYEDAFGNHRYSNDGATISKHIDSSDPFVNQTIAVIRTSSLATNTEAGDGTSSTVLCSSVLIKEGLNLLRSGWNPMDVRDAFTYVGNKMKDTVEQFTHKVNGDKDLFFIANVSASDDKEIADNTVKTIKITGKEGQVMINAGYSSETEIIEDTGFIFGNGLFSPELAQNKTFSASYQDVPVFITDKRLYYEQEAEAILTTALNAGFSSIVIVASDFMGEALPVFIENHQRGVINVLLIKETRAEILSDLSVYLDTNVISDKSGALDKLSIKNFTKAKMAFSNKDKTIISREDKKQGNALKARVKEIKAEMKNVGDKYSQEYKNLESRLASLTRGMVIIKVGGRTPIEIHEKIFRYEDAVNATRVSMDGGYVAGGGITLINTWNAVDKKDIDPEIKNVFDKYSESITRQILINCGERADVFLDKINNSANSNMGYNAVSGKITNLIKDGVIEPQKVFMQVIDNSISIANAILTSTYRIVNEADLDIKKDNK